MNNLESGPTGGPMPSGTQPYSVPASESIIDTLKHPRTILRIIEWFFAVIAFSTIAEYPHFDAISFMLFVGVVGWLLTMVFLAVYIFRPIQTQGRVYAYAELVITAIWVVFWFAASVAVAALGCPACGNLKASVAFGFFSFGAWIASTWFAFMDLRAL
ncbi:membrane-associating domain-containing protein [Phlyctochytrium arcticum]|nr:membrane-associating domain-containing protein [Phlyctochytrium arcticum]